MSDLPNILTAKDIARYLRLAPNTVYGLMDVKPEHGGIPCFSVGKSRRVERADFEKWLRSKKSG